MVIGVLDGRECNVAFVGVLLCLMSDGFIIWEFWEHSQHCVFSEVLLMNASYVITIFYF